MAGSRDNSLLVFWGTAPRQASFCSLLQCLRELHLPSQTPKHLRYLTLFISIQDFTRK